MSRDKSHVSGGDPDECFQVVMAPYRCGIPGISSQTRSTMTTKKGVVVSVDEARSCRIAFRMSPGSYSGFAVHEHVRR